MTFNEFQNFTATTAIYPKEKGLEYTLFGLANEVGEVLGVYKKIIRDSNNIMDEERKYKMIDELSDVAYYLASVARELDVTLEEVIYFNVIKLSRRKENNTIKGSGDR